MLDTHYHLDQLTDPQRASLLPDAFQQGVSGIVAPAMGVASFEKNRQIAANFPGKVFVAAGVHPERPPSPALLEEAEFLCQSLLSGKERVVAVGEIGLPFYTGEKQVSPLFFSILEQFLQAAHTLHLPVILHAVHTRARPVLERLRAFSVEKAVFHWLKVDEPETARAIAQAGYFCSLTPEVLHRKRDQALLSLFPKEQILLETDGPEPLVGFPSPSSPALILQSARFVAQKIGCAEEQFDENARRFFSL